MCISTQGLVLFGQNCVDLHIVNKYYECGGYETPGDKPVLIKY